MASGLYLKLADLHLFFEVQREAAGSPDENQGSWEGTRRDLHGRAYQTAKPFAAVVAPAIDSGKEQAMGQRFGTISTSDSKLRFMSGHKLWRHRQVWTMGYSPRQGATHSSTEDWM